MKVLMFTVFALMAYSTAALAQSEISVTAGMQSCTSNADCGLVATSCAQACSSTPVNVAALDSINARYRDYCGFEAEARPKCNITPPLQAACLNQRCTLKQAAAMGGDPRDFPTGGYIARDTASTSYSNAPAPLKAANGYSSSNEKGGNFTAYDLPQEQVKKNIMGQYRFEKEEDVAPAAGDSAEQPVREYR